MRADEAILHGEDLINYVGIESPLNYINQLRYERLMAKACYYRLRMSDYVDRYSMSPAVSMYTRKKYEQCKRIAEALEARARRIKDGM